MDATGSPKRARIAPRALALGGVGGNDLDRRAADLGLQRGRGALGDDVAVVDDPDAVGEHVGLLEVLGRQEDGDAVLAAPAADLLPERGAALDVEAGGRLVEEEDARAVDERERQVEPALHPARVAAHLAVGGFGQADALEQLVGARPALGPRQRLEAACRRRCSRPVSSGSSAASCSAAPIARAPAGPASTTSKPATRAVPTVGGSSVVEHQHGGRLAGAVRAEEAVDLARGRSQVDAVDRPRAFLELPDEALGLDGETAAHSAPVYLDT